MANTDNIIPNATGRTEERPTIAMIYDFDDTLIHGNMQEYGFIKDIGYENDAFWKEVKKLKKTKGFKDGILAYMYLMVDATRKQQHKHITKKNFHALGQKIKFVQGVNTWDKCLQKRK